LYSINWPSILAFWRPRKAVRVSVRKAVLEQVTPENSGDEDVIVPGTPAKLLGES
jgi:hypothetical protein